MGSWDWHVGLNAPKGVVFREAINAINTLGIGIDIVDEYNGIIEAKKKDFWGGDQYVKISILNQPNVVPKYKEGCAVYIKVYQRQMLADGRCGLTGSRIMQVIAERLAPLGYGEMVELAPTRFGGKPSAYVSHPQAQPSPPPQPNPLCPTCGGQLTFVQQYNRWYCYNCRKYA